MILFHCCSRAVISNKRLIVHQGINDSLSFSVWTIAHAWLTSAPEYSSKTLSPSSCNRSVNRLQTRVVLHCCVCFCRAASVLMMSNHETVRAWLREHVYRLLSALVLVLITWLWCGAPIQPSVCLLTLPAVVCPILTPWNCTFISLPLFCRVDVVKFGADACRCGN